MADEAINKGDAPDTPPSPEQNVQRRPSMDGTATSPTNAVWKKYDKYVVPVEQTQFDRSTIIDGAANMGVGVLCKCDRPHMRGFHGAWMGFFIAFLSWFAFAPLMGEVRTSLKLTKNEIWISNMFSVTSTVILRFLIGPLNDVYGPRFLMSSVLMGGGVMVFFGGTISDAVGLVIIRFFIGFIGACFVMCQYWTSMMFAKNIVGTANAWSAGWGNLGGGVTQIFMGAMVFPLMKVFTDNDNDTAWRLSFLVPGVLTIGIGLWIRNYTDDCPYGNYWEMKQHGHKMDSAVVSTKRGVSNITAWMIFVQYACCFGVELHMNNLAALYFRDKFNMSTEASSTIASLFGLMNLFARTLGGVTTDYLNKKFAMRGRLAAQTICLLMEGIFILIFAAQDDLGAAIVCLICFSMAVQMSEGTTYAIVPYVDPPVTGTIAGIIGAGGNLGAVCWSMIWIFGDDIGNSQDKLSVLGIIVMCSSLLSLVMKVKGHPAIIPLFTDSMVNTGLEDERSWIFTAEAEACKKKCDDEGRPFDPVAERKLVKASATQL